MAAVFRCDMGTRRIKLRGTKAETDAAPNVPEVEESGLPLDLSVHPTQPVGESFQSNDPSRRLVAKQGSSGSSIRVEVPNERLTLWPQQCACCGDDAQTTTKVEWKRRRHTIETFTRNVPACVACDAHRRVMLPRFESLFVFLFFLGFIVCLALGFIAKSILGLVFFVLLVAGAIVVSRKSEEIRRSKAEPMMKENCAAADFVSWYQLEKGLFFTHTIIDVYAFARRSYAVEFSKVNRGTILEK